MFVPVSFLLGHPVCHYYTVVVVLIYYEITHVYIKYAMCFLFCVVLFFLFFVLSVHLKFKFIFDKKLLKISTLILNFF